MRQLLCLYPFPHFSHRSSLPLARLPPSFVTRDPSLARLVRDLLLPFSVSGMEASGGPSVTTLPFPKLEGPAKLEPLFGRLLGIDGWPLRPGGPRGA